MAEAPLPNWSYERLLQLAPDSQTLEQARRLFFARRWQILAGNGHYLWGEYHTAYGHQYQAVVGFEPARFRCNCKSPRRPCKHSLALVLLFLNRPEAWIVREELPDWAQALLGKAITEPTTHKKPLPTNTAQQEKRVKLMDDGVQELAKWLRNTQQQGLASLREAPDEWLQMAARLVDAKLGGVARRLRHCHHILNTDNWLPEVVAELSLLSLFVRAWERKNDLSSAQKRELQQIAGWNIRKDYVLNLNGEKDNWLVIGLSFGEEEKLQYRRTWLWGEKTGAYALLLDFAFGNRGFEEQWVVGSVLHGEVVYYPGQPALRAIFKSYVASRTPYSPASAYSNWMTLGKAYSSALGQSPWLHAFPAVLADVMPIYDEEESSFYLLDNDKCALPLVENELNWQLLAHSSGQAIMVFGEFFGDRFSPLSIVKDGRVSLLS